MDPAVPSYFLIKRVKTMLEIMRTNVIYNNFLPQSYPDEDHSLAGVRPHLYHTLGRFFSECFDLRD